MDDSSVIINVEHLTKDYGYGRGVFDVSIKVHKGECYGYLGPNGAGKSTTIRHIMGFSKPTTGSTKIEGIETFGRTDEILGKVGYLPGEVALPNGLNGEEFLNMIQLLRGSANKEMLDYLLKKFRLNPKMNIKLASLGDKRKLAVVAAFMNDPDVLILDEPTSGLDPVMQEEFINFIIEEKKRGKTILLSSHIFNEVDRTCDTISIIKDGHHVSTFNANELKHGNKKTYILSFENKSDLDKFVKECSYAEIKKEDELSISAFFSMNELSNFLKLAADNHATSLEEVKFSLQDYFMKFYKEEKEFTGLSGIKGNEKGSK